jgi:hypothetical protein
MRTDQIIMKKTKKPSPFLMTKTTATVATTQMAVSMKTYSLPREIGPRMATSAPVLHTRDDASTNEANEVPKSTQTQAQSLLLCKTKQ